MDTQPKVYLVISDGEGGVRLHGAFADPDAARAAMYEQVEGQIDGDPEFAALHAEDMARFRAARAATHERYDAAQRLYSAATGDTRSLYVLGTEVR